MKTKKKAAATGKIYAVVGSDESAVKTTAKEMAAQLAPADAGDFGVEIIDGCADNAEQAAARIRLTIEALQTLPFFGGGKLVWLKNANFLGDNVLGRAANVLDALENLAVALETDFGSEQVKFLLSAPEVDKRRSFYKTLGKRAELQVFDKLDASRSGWEEQATDLVQSLGRRRQLRFDDEAIDLFVLLTGGDTRVIENELEKIDLYLGEKERRVTLENVRTLVPISRGGVIFELGNALAGRHLQRALTLVRRLLDQGESAVGILLVAIIPTVRNLLLAKDLMQRHRLPRPSAPFSFISTLNRLPNESTAHLPRKKDGSVNGYALGLAAMHAHRFEVPQLIVGLEACLTANLQIVSTQLDHELVLNQVVVKLLALA
ncbi:MAG TPA: DNA polymerase III subunit delta [Chthoniobacterales bacterium]|jgi:DNA polymerase-3 subunit delta|nr:DNA polymerase III subunit delta [Chthoniobacterales bacterium]